MEVMVSSLNEHPKVQEWLDNYITKPHEHLGRKGSVCPVVKTSLSANTINIETAIYDPKTDNLEDLYELMRHQIDHFVEMKWPEGKASIAALVTVVKGIPEHQMILFDEAQRRVKGYAVKKGCMIGQFQPHSAEPAVLNPSFPVSRSPEPLFAIRYMAQHDALFLHQNPKMFAEYQKRFGHLYEDPEKPMPETYTKMYNLGLQRGSGRSSYIDYQSIDVLLALQHPNTDHPSEMSFYISGQVKELLFKLIFEQTNAIRMALAGDHIDNAVWSLRRITAALNVLSSMWDLLSTLAPTEFNTFREQLKDASGTDSYMFRMVEFALGRKSEALAERFKSIPGIAEDVYRAFYNSSIYDEALFILVRHGLLAQDAANPETRDTQAVEAAWAKVYQTYGPSHELFRLAEALMDVAERFGRWRSLHLLTVERMIGSKSGTGGTDGITWLKRSAEHRFFPELWDARTLLSSGPAPF